MDDIYISKSAGEPREVDIFSQPPMPEKPKKNRKKKRLLKIICIILVCSIVISSTLITVIAAVSGYTRNNLKANKYALSVGLFSSPFVDNILLLGTDEKSQSVSRSDSMILVSLDFVHSKIKLTSFLRDCWVKIPSRKDKAKLNAAYAYGGAQLTVDTIEYNFRVNIDHYIKVDFEMFTKIIDKLGGVDVEVTEKEANFINRTTKQHIDSGKSVHLNGEEALVYCRIRKLDTDYMRTYRQRKVISALLKKASDAGIIKLVAMMKDIFPLIETDLSPFEINILAYKAFAALLFFKTQSTRVPPDDMMQTDTVSGQWVEIPDLDKVKKYLHNFIYKNSDVFDDEM